MHILLLSTLADRIAAFPSYFQQAEPVDASVIVIAGISLLMVVAHAIWSHAHKRSVDWVGENSSRPWW